MLSSRFYDNGKLRLVAGAQESIPDFGDTGSSGDSAIGQQFWFGTQVGILGYAGVGAIAAGLVPASGLSRTLIWSAPDGRPLGVFRSGVYNTAVGFEQNVNAQGNFTGRSRQLSQGERAQLGFPGTAVSTSSSGFAPQPFLSTQAGFEAKTAADIAAQEEAQQFANQQRLESEKSAKSLQLIQGANALAQARGQQIQQARTLLAQTLGQDVVKGAALLSGGLGFGTSPNESFRGQLQGFVDEPTAAFDPNAPLATQQGQFDALQGQVAGQAPIQPTIGFAKGGTISLDKKVRQAILVGEPREDGRPNPEVVIIEDGKMTVAPITAQAVHGQNFDFNSNPNRGRFGGNFGTGFGPTASERTLQPIGGSRFGEGADIESITSTAAPIFEHLGFNTIPFGVRRNGGPLRALSQRQAGGPLSQMGLSFAGLGALGINPRLFRLGTTVFFRDRDGTLKKFRDMDQFNELQFNRNEIIQVAPTGTELAALRAEAENAPFVTGRNSTSESNAGFSATSATAIVSPTTGLLLPNPAQIASMLRPGVLNPQQRGVIASLYQDANIDPDALQEQASFFTPSGSAQLGVQAGFG